MKTISENIQSIQPNIAELQRLVPKHGNLLVFSILVHALNEVKNLVNVGKNLTDLQISFIAQKIMSQYWMLKIEEVKYVLHRGIEQEKLFDRLDPNIVLQWFANYNDERICHAIDISNQKETEALNRNLSNPEAITYSEWLDRLKTKSNNGDIQASDLLTGIENRLTHKAGHLTNEEKHRKDVNYKQWYYNEYLKKKIIPERLIQAKTNSVGYSQQETRL